MCNSEFLFPLLQSFALAIVQLFQKTPCSVKGEEESYILKVAGLRVSITRSNFYRIVKIYPIGKTSQIHTPFHH